MEERFDREWQLATLRGGSAVWNLWRTEYLETKITLSGANLSEANLHGADLGEADLSEADLHGADLSGADLSGADLSGADLSEADLSGADLSEADLSEADLFKANLFRANLFKANLFKANLSGANLSGADLGEADLGEANLSGADLGEADLSGANLFKANLSGADLGGANLSGAYLREADLSGAYLREANLGRAYLHGADLSGAYLFKADLSEAILERVVCVGTDLSGATLTGCTIYGIACWDVQLDGTIQQNLRITPYDQPAITVDNLAVAQFIYLLLNNQNIRQVIDTMARKAVLILGSFTDGRLAVLQSLREALRQRNYLPILFDFEKSVERDYTETVVTLAHLSKFVIADLTHFRSVPQEFQSFIPNVAIPIKPVIEQPDNPWAMFADFRKYSWVLAPFHYVNQEDLLQQLDEQVIGPAETKRQELLATIRSDNAAGTTTS